MSEIMKNDHASVRSAGTRKTKVIYLSYTGLAEPLGRSQVLNYLRGLAAFHCITLVSFERSSDLGNSAVMAELSRDCADAGISWHAMKYHHRPRLPAKAWDLIIFAYIAFREARKVRADLVHARSYIPAFVALIIKRILGIPYVFDMRATWPEELVVARRLKKDTLLFRMVKAAEKSCLLNAWAVVSLTHAGVRRIRSEYSRDLTHTRFEVIPTCVDLVHFRPAEKTTPKLVLGWVGTILSGGYEPEWFVAFCKAAFDALPETQVEIITRDDPGNVLRVVKEAGLPNEQLKVLAALPREVPNFIRGHSVLVMFYTPGAAKAGTCPTRMGEALACGLPIVANSGVGDVAEIVRKYNVGVIVDGRSPSAMNAAFRELEDLLDDTDLSHRCRRAAEEWFSLDKGILAYDKIYCALGASASLPENVNQNEPFPANK